MKYSLIFQSNIFDWKSEPPFDGHDIPGLSMGQHLSPLLVQNGIQVTDIEAEDWGWYLDATLDGRTYMIGFIVLPKAEGEYGDECIVHIEKNRSILEKLTGKNKMQDNDPMLITVRHLASEIKDVKGITLERR